MSNDIRQSVYEVIAEVLGVPQEQVTDESSPDTIDEWDSMQHMNLTMALEQKFRIQFSEDQLMEMLSADLIYDCVCEQLAD